jgi:hypothetical protein
MVEWMATILPFALAVGVAGDIDRPCKIWCDTNHECMQDLGKVERWGKIWETSSAVLKSMGEYYQCTHNISTSTAVICRCVSW